MKFISLSAACLVVAPMTVAFAPINTPSTTTGTALAGAFDGKTFDIRRNPFARGGKDPWVFENDTMYVEEPKKKVPTLKKKPVVKPKPVLKKVSVKKPVVKKVAVKKVAVKKVAAKKAVVKKAVVAKKKIVAKKVAPTKTVAKASAPKNPFAALFSK